MKFVDTYLTCQECGKRFCFSAREQMSYDDKKIESVPVRCLHCRKEQRKKMALRQKGIQEYTCRKCGTTFYAPLSREAVSFCDSCLSQLSLLV
ncbi:MAG TPA: zinc-ribbon domain containing protein [Patescibacteria group bacterium]|nr:zinc-ribbon domain containing protein [Patescibacteria group bacterium]